MTLKRPKMNGMHHVALQVRKYEETRAFYINQMGLQIEWEPDSDNVYLTSGTDNIALHRAEGDIVENAQTLDHIGFTLGEIEQVDEWYAYLLELQTEIVNPPRTHRDGARSLYFKDPEGTLVQMIYHPPLAKN